MEQMVNGAPPVQEHLSAIYAPVANELAEVDAVLRRELNSPDPLVSPLVQHAFRLGGKRLRPMLLLLTGQATGELTPEHTTMAAVVEMIHTATLVHDDILDGATVRRHLPTVHARWDTSSSVLVGDYLFTHAFYLASTTNDANACRIIGEATNTVCEGEIRQVQQQGNLELREDEYLEIVAAKTGALCAACCELGAHFSNVSSATKRQAATFGRDLGIAFQIADDVLDVVGKEETTGKTLGTDLAQTKLTLPVIRMLNVLDDARRNEALRSLTEEDSEAARLRALLDETDAVEYSRAVARRYADQATDVACRFVDEERLGPFRQILDFVVSRVT